MTRGVGNAQTSFFLKIVAIERLDYIKSENELQTESIPKIILQRKLMCGQLDLQCQDFLQELRELIGRSL